LKATTNAHLDYWTEIYTRYMYGKGLQHM